MRRKTMALFTIGIHFYQSKFLLPLYPYQKLNDATKGPLFLLKAVPTSLLVIKIVFWIVGLMMTLSHRHFMAASNRNRRSL